MLPMWQAGSFPSAGLPGCAGLTRAGLSSKGQKDAGLWAQGEGHQRTGVFSGQGGSYPSPSAGQMEVESLLSDFLAVRCWPRSCTSLSLSVPAGERVVGRPE